MMDADKGFTFVLVNVQKWHPDKHKGDSAITAKFQEINEAYTGDCLLKHTSSCIPYCIWTAHAR